MSRVAINLKNGTPHLELDSKKQKIAQKCAKISKKNNQKNKIVQQHIKLLRKIAM